MTDYAGHRNRTISPWLTEGKVKLVIFDILIAIDVSLR